MKNHTITETNWKFGTVSIEDLFEYHNIDGEEQEDNYMTDELEWDLEKIRELLDDYTQDKITEKYGDGWMMNSASIGNNISFDYELDSIIYEKDLIEKKG